ncbi:hypothetical protein DICVIV_10092 [Dictyocaulus viviparus]|uniref:G-protein coupled receptors family 1 profile domain-containing protein n=1 Tax=Dictyocaulus viviparus TaxID=29172 RepID=A0A0D8XJ88_DICVI|nr:hypothetical protein DICVIV_10092 [Dictyocaulus viviparus]
MLSPMNISAYEQHEFWKAAVKYAPTIIPIAILYFEIVGLFGNINLIIATIRDKHLHTKHGVLLAMTSLYQSFCLLFELINVIIGFRGISLQRHTCFLMMMPFMLFGCIQSAMYIILSLDTWFSILFPLRLILCTMPLTIEPSFKKIWVYGNLLVNLTVLVIYFFIFLTVVIKDKRRRKLSIVVNETDEKRVFFSLMWLMTIFASTWCTCMLLQAIAFSMEPSYATVAVENYSLIFSLMGYSINYYVYFARNETYRRTFLQQLSCILPKRFNEALKSKRSTPAVNGILRTSTIQHLAQSPSIKSTPVLSSHPHHLDERRTRSCINQRTLLHVKRV